jgi:long-chain acyl-CoA synthetase
LGSEETEMANIESFIKRVSMEYFGNVGGLLDRAYELHADRDGIGISGQLYSFREYHDRVCRMVHGLRKIGIERGSRIIFASSNNLHYAFISLAVFRIGAVLVPVNQRIRHHELAHILKDTKSRFMICERSCMERAVKACEDYEDITPPIFVTLDERAPSTVFIDEIDISIPDTHCEALPPDTTALIIYTAGTSGYVLGAELTHGSIFYDAISFADASIKEEEKNDDAIASALPLFHSYGFTNGLLVPLAGCVTCHLLETSIRRAKIASLLEEFDVKQIISVPALFLSLLKPLAERPGLCSRLKNLTSGGIQIPEELLLAYRKKLGLDIREGYGLTETSPVVTWNAINRPAKFGTVGYPLSCCEVKIVDDNGLDLPVGQEGEVWIRGLNVFSGYLNNPEQTKKAFSDDWFKTGDLGRLDDDQYLTITGLKKDMLNILGLKVYPKEVERILSFHPGIESVRIWGDWDPRHGNIVAGEISLNGHPLNEKDVYEWCKENISPYKIPRKIKIKGKK